MIWHVHGTDAATGREVEIAIDEIDAPAAIKAAMDRQIVVSHVAGEARARWRKIIAPLAWATCAVVAVGSAAVLIQNLSLRGTLDQALTEQARLAQSLATAENTAAQIQQNGHLADDQAVRMQKLASDLAAARSRMSLTESQLSTAHSKMMELEKTAQDLPAAQNEIAGLRNELATAQQKLAAAEKSADGLRAELALESRRMDQLERVSAPAPAPDMTAELARLQKDNQDLQTEVDKLKGELLVTVARATAPQEATQADSAPATAPSDRWAIATPFDAARDFLVLHVDHDSLAMSAASDGLAATSGVQAENAAKLRIVHDLARERVYSAAVSVSLAPDGPKDKLAENRKLVGDFLHAFAPKMKDVDAFISGAISDLAKRDARERESIRQGAVELTVSNDGGVYTFLVDAAKNDGN